jgi:hypothetical protein
MRATTRLLGFQEFNHSIHGSAHAWTLANQPEACNRGTNDFAKLFTGRQSLSRLDTHAGHAQNH